MEQQHVAAYLAGQGGPQMMTGDTPQGIFLKETQQCITAEEQVSILLLCDASQFIPHLCQNLPACI